MTRPGVERLAAPTILTRPTCVKSHRRANILAMNCRGRKVVGMNPLVRHWVAYSRYFLRQVLMNEDASSEPLVKVFFTACSYINSPEKAGANLIGQAECKSSRYIGAGSIETDGECTSSCLREKSPVKCRRWAMNSQIRLNLKTTPTKLLKRQDCFTGGL